jgi:gliding motility-associated-like protein
MKDLFSVILCTLFNFTLAGQTCVNLGQNPNTAFPVCGTSVFKQTNVPTCGGVILPQSYCGPYPDKNPFWYKFTCFQSGTLGFLITPNDLSSDYDWQLYDITGKDPMTVYTDGSMIVASNWSGEKGLTGASTAGTKQFVCGGPGQPLFSVMPALIVGHEYLLLISHFTDTQFGYSLSFGGGTAKITDPNVPRFKRAESSCGGNAVRLKLDKKIRCNSISADGSEFFITPSIGATVNSVGIGCTANFDTDSIEIKFNQTLPPGNYTLNIKTGTDGNTLLDYCGQPVATTETASFSVVPVVPTPMDSIAPFTCAPNSLRLIFSKPISCASIAANGTDFRINGPYAVGVTSAKGSCSGTNTVSKEIILTLSQPLQKGGNFTLTLQKGSDGNTILNECGVETPNGSAILFSLPDTVNADFTYNIQYGCTEDIIDFSHPGRNGVNQWKWNLDDNISSNQQNPQGKYKVFDPKNIELIVTNGFCSDTSRKSVLLDNFLKAGFNSVEDNCHSEPVAFKSTSVGKITEYKWEFGDGLIGRRVGDSIIHTYGPPAGTKTYTVRHTVTDMFGCSQSVEKNITIYVNCHIDVPNAFTPNADMKNDLLYPLNAIKAEQLDFKVYNRWGQLIFQTSDWKKGWDGRYNGKLQPTGTYVWTLRYVHRDTKQLISTKGTSFLVR